ncbi:RagB/SusD family nutrient uptake outer membrane protein [Hymenobacter arizonensis]|uniref:Starch-binding associating with outer membrane n=1 Tax=Hymenobacter arizonensis TaxID=1227077 RepID=A0A1I6AS55_HYMAR|nr:RagB/SusD family nutrient uptake outer membrane protein [Hymenobacter arizonensis]SFQ71472.1 Starch-binding associating with outer membrane [Hymenobacter arizonensis]
MKKNIDFCSRRLGALLLVGVLGLGLPSCSLDLVNPNAATEQQTLTTREGVLALSVGLRQLYSTVALEPIIITTGTTARELKGVTTFFNVIELEQGGAQLSPNNANTTALFSRNYRVVNVADQIIAAAPAVLAADERTRSGVLAHAYLFKAAALGAVAMGFEQGPLTANPDGNGTTPFVSRAQLLAEAVRLLDLAAQELAANPPSPDFNTQVQGTEFNLPNTVQAYRARFNLIAGNYAAALTAANLVNLSTRSAFTYSPQNPNPVFTFTTQVGNFKPRDFFGLPANLAEAGDGRLGFYLSGPVVVDRNNGGPDNLRNLAGFFTSQTAAIPAYLPDEMRLIRAEVYLRQATPDLTAALADINAVRTQSSGDPFGVHANLPAYSGPVTVPALLTEVYKQRSSELYLSGLRLEDSRRFGRPTPTPTPTPGLLERTRNFYPYPQQERVNNPSTPNDPTI